jgi:TRAP-type transport system small permease protein
VSNGLAALTNVALGAIGTILILVTGYAVLMRYVFHSPPTWSHETSVVCFVWISFLGAANAMKARAHIVFNFFIDLFSGRSYNAVVGLADVLTLMTLGLGCVLGVQVALAMMPQSFQTIPLSLGVLYLALPTGFLCMTVHGLDLALEHWEIAVTKGEVIPKAVS